MIVSYRRIGLAILVLALVGSLGLNVVLYRMVLARYLQEQALRLDPSGASRFEGANAALPARDDGRLRVVLLGDSRVEMWSPPPGLGSDVEVVNRGWSSETTAQTLLRLDRDVLALGPDLAVVQVGINDLKGIGLLPRQARAIEQDCGRRLEQIVERLRARGVSVVLLTIFPVGPIPLGRRLIWSDATLGAVARVNERIGRLQGPGVAVIDCDAVLADGGRMRRSYAVDEFHMTAAGYAALNRHLEPILRGLLTDRASRPASAGRPARSEDTHAIQ